MRLTQICYTCHKPMSDLRHLCKTCVIVQGHYDRVEEARIAQLRHDGWLPPEVKTIRNNKEKK